MSKLCEFCAKLQNMKVFLKMLTNQNCFKLKSISPASSYMFVFLVRLMKRISTGFLGSFTDIVNCKMTDQFKSISLSFCISC